jgi:hypothetical protein
VLPNHWVATFDDAFTMAVGPGPRGIAARDLDRDGDPDVVVTIAEDHQVFVAPVLDPRQYPS